MTLIDRLVGTGSDSISVHQFMALLAEFRRDAPGVDQDYIESKFDITDAAETTELENLIDKMLDQRLSRELLHDVLLLGEGGIYTTSEVDTRIVTSPPDTEIWPQVVERSFDVVSLSQNGDHVVQGCQVSAQSTPNLTVQVSEGVVVVGNNAEAVAAVSSLAVTTPDANLPRLDVVYVNSSGTVAVKAGTAAKIPDPPTVGQNEVALAFLFVRSGASQIGGSAIQSTRIVRNAGPIMIGQNTSKDSRSNLSSFQVFASQSIPKGLLDGNAVRFKAGGYLTMDAVGGGALEIKIRFGGVDLYQDIGPVLLQSGTERGWWLEFILIGRSSTSQELVGQLSCSNIAVPTSPDDGFGDLTIPATVVPIGAVGTIDTDADTENIAISMRTTNASVDNEVTMEFYTAELL